MTDGRRAPFSATPDDRVERRRTSAPPARKALAFLLSFLLSHAVAFASFPSAASASCFPVFGTWPQPGGPGSPMALSYSYINLLDGGMLDPTGQPVDNELMETIFVRAFLDYATHIPIHFWEEADAGPMPETGDYDPTGLPQIRIGEVPDIPGANAYAYFPADPPTGLAGDIVFNGLRDGIGWSELWFYAVAQHEIAHSLGLGHAEPCPEPLEGAIAPLGEIPTFQPYPYTGPTLDLPPDMVTALQDIYGVGTGSVNRLPEPSGALAVGALALFALNRRRRAVARRSP